MLSYVELTHNLSESHEGIRASLLAHVNHVNLANLDVAVDIFHGRDHFGLHHSRRVQLVLQLQLLLEVGSLLLCTKLLFLSSMSFPLCLGLVANFVELLHLGLSADVQIVLVSLDLGPYLHVLVFLLGVLLLVLDDVERVFLFHLYLDNRLFLEEFVFKLLALQILLVLEMV